MLEGFTAPLSDTEPVTITQVIFPSPLTQLLMALIQLLQRHTSPSPLVITLSSYNNQIVAVEDVERLLTFTHHGGSGNLSRQQADASVDGFQRAFIRYLHGTGHVPGTAPAYVTVEEYNLRASDLLLRARATLRQLTDSWLLPVGDDPEDKIKVRRAFWVTQAR